MKYLFSAGEASGDLHASHLMAALRALDPGATFTFLGGDLMAAEAGCAPMVHYRDLAYMGFTDVARHLPEILATLRRARAEIVRTRPDAVVLVDYPGFNLRLAREARKLGVAVFYYIPPKVWAWKSWRVNDLRRCCAKVLSILPFEKEWFAARGLDVDYVGNPSVAETDARLAALAPRSRFIADHDITSRPILALVPGSRLSEIRANLPVMQTVARRTELQAVVAGAPGVEMEFYRRYTTLPVIQGDTLGLMAHAEAALVTSGTATLECALAGTPQIVCYRSNGSRLTYQIMKRVLKVGCVSLPNLILGCDAVPEMLLHQCTPANILAALGEIMPGRPGRDAQLRAYARMRTILGNNDAATTAARSIIATLRQ